MKKGKSKAKNRLFLFGVLVLLFIPLQLTAQDEETDEPKSECNPAENNLAAEMNLAADIGIECQELLGLINSGAGLGEIKKAWQLSQNLGAGTDNWQALLEMKQQGTGWGHIKKAYYLADSHVDVEGLLALKQSGIGWGVIQHAQALANADLGISFEQALELFQSGKDWDEIREDLGLPNGPPPWSGGSKERAGSGKPPWANGNSPPKADKK